MAEKDRVFIRELVNRNRYLTLATASDSSPWIATLEYISDIDLNLYYFSPEDATHSRQLLENEDVCVSIFDAVQPQYEPAPAIRIAGLQLIAKAQKLNAPYAALVEKQIQTWSLPLPPYAAYIITPVRWYIPVIKDGVNERLEVDMK